MRCRARTSKKFILALDAGTTSSRSLVFDERGNVVAQAQREFTQYFPPTRLGRTRRTARSGRPSAPRCRSAARRAARRRATSRRSASPTSAKPPCCGIGPRARPLRAPSSGRTGAPPRPAKSCAPPGRTGDRRRAPGCCWIRISPATKLAWLLDHVPGARARAERGELAFGTVDSWLLFKLTAHRRHVTDATNASRTLLYNLRNGDWDDRLLELLRIPRACLPRDRRHQPGAHRGASRSTSTASNYR